MGDERDGFGQQPQVKPRRILFVESAADMGGVQFSTLYLASRLDDGWLPLVVCPAEGKLSAACRAAGVETAIVRYPDPKPTSLRVDRRDRRLPNPFAWTVNLRSAAVARRGLIDLIRLYQPALIVTKGLFAHVYGGFAARGAGTPCIWHMQDFISERHFGLYRRALAPLARRLPDKIIADGGAIAAQLPRSVSPRTVVVLNGVDTTEFYPAVDGLGVRAEFGIRTGETLIGHVARITPWKGQGYLLDAFALVAGSCPNTKLLLVGAPLFDDDNFLTQLKARVRDLDLDARVVFAGFRDDLPQVLAAMDIFAYPSIEKDTSPLALLSAMASGLPVVAFDIPGVREVVDGAGLLVPNRQTNALSGGLLELLSDVELRCALSTRSRDHAVEHLNLEKHVERMSAVFENTVSGSRRY